MREISEAMAMYLFNSGAVVYKLYADGTEAKILDDHEISEHRAYDGIFAVEE